MVSLVDLDPDILFHTIIVPYLNPIFTSIPRSFLEVMGILAPCWHQGSPLGWKLDRNQNSNLSSIIYIIPIRLLLIKLFTERADQKRVRTSEPEY